MKRVSLILLCLLFLSLPSVSRPKPILEQDNGQSKVFIYHLPDPVVDENPKNETQNISSDDITADTSISIENEELLELNIDEKIPNILKGYAIYEEEEEEESVALETEVSTFSQVNLNSPLTMDSGKFITKGSKYLQSNTMDYSKFNNVEYSIAPISSRNYKKFGDFLVGTTYDQGIDYAELEQTTGVFSRYENKYFAISTAYAKTVNSTNNNYNDNFYFAPELKLNQYFTLKEIISADISKNRKKAEVVLSINPFGNKDKDKLKFEIKANATYDDNNTLYKNQLKFVTKFKL